MRLTDFSEAAIANWNAEAPAERTLDVTWFLPPESPPQQNLRLTIGSGRLLDITPLSNADRSQALPVAVIPPLVNVHAHLEFSTLEKPLTPASPFPDWIRSVIRWRMQNPDTARDAIAAGIAESCRQGVAVLGDITTSNDAVTVLDHSKQCVVSFRELLGILPDRIPAQLEILTQHLERLLPDRDRPLRRGISPHAPYSVHPDLLSAAADVCRDQDVPLVMHIAETRDELELLDQATGRFVDFLGEMNLWDRQVFIPGRDALFYLEQLAKVPHALAVHCNYLTDDEIHFLGRNPHVAVVYCPRTHQYFGHEPHPWRKILAAGGTVVLGTDGRSSNPDLSIWRELQFVGRRPDAPPVSELIPLVTTAACRSLGLELENDRLQTNRILNATLIQLSGNSNRGIDDLLEATSSPIATLSTTEGKTAVNLCSSERNPRHEH